MKIFSKSQETIIRQEIYQIICIIKNIKLIGIDLTRQTNIAIPQQNNLTETLEEDDCAAMIFLAEKHQKTYFKTFFRFIKCNRII